MSLLFISLLFSIVTSNNVLYNIAQWTSRIEIVKQFKYSFQQVWGVSYVMDIKRTHFSVVTDPYILSLLPSGESMI